ncbi:SAM-dependent methyltransferase [Amycolatopsis endophytica]|uniref:SAM-dependent methyltransferase n=1 Tax=Amycolatopsis endophytica TaxID=860233 RepID=A0A853BC31_9PSEU|nr:SAM-dependent methyltransferase [Amycolatopsis endophytica]NYI92933.1 SAM-dependent methyltransferase [Amycolatopsis endophytica]
MFDYGILLYPGANRVYADAAAGLLRAELAVFGEALATPPAAVGERRIGGVTYVTFSTETALSEEDIALLSNLSSLYALFEFTGDLLRPLEIAPLDKLDSDLLTIQKYPGKTNELFTKLLLNVTLLSRERPAEFLTRPLHVVDPLCGRGTTLNQAMMYGLDATGLDVDKKDFEAYERFVKTWLRQKRIKHTADSGPLRRHKHRLGQRLEISYAPDKERWKAGDARAVTFFNADTLTTDELLKAGSADVVVADAPYGVQHGSHQPDELARSPRDLLNAALPVWTRVLKPGGALGLSWNTHVAKRDEITGILERTGLEVRSGGPFEEFTHRVDQSILRDLVVARKPA